MNESWTLADVPSMQIRFEKMARQMLECADFITHYSDIMTACESNRLHRRLTLHVISLRRGKTCHEHLQINHGHDSEIQQCSPFSTLMRRFRDLAVRDTLINVHDIGESLPLYRECSLTLEPLTWM